MKIAVILCLALSIFLTFVSTAVPGMGTSNPNASSGTPSQNSFTCESKFVVSGNERAGLFGQAPLRIKCDDVVLTLSGLQEQHRVSAFQNFKNLYENASINPVTIDMPNVKATFKKGSDSPVAQNAVYTFATHDADGFKVEITVTITVSNAVSSVKFISKREKDANANVDMPHKVVTLLTPLTQNPLAPKTAKDASHVKAAKQKTWETSHRFIENFYFAVRRTFKKTELAELDDRAGIVTKTRFSDNYYVMAKAFSSDNFGLVIGKNDYALETVVPSTTTPPPASPAVKPPAPSPVTQYLDYTTIGITLFVLGGVYLAFFRK